MARINRYNLIKYQHVSTLADNKLSEVWVVSRMIPGAYSLELRFFTNEDAAKNFCAHYPGAEYNKYPLVESFLDEAGSTMMG